MPKKQSQKNKAVRSPAKPGSVRKNPSSPRKAVTENHSTRPKDADATRKNILDEATREFAENGYSGARVDTIADKTRTSKRMIYYYSRARKGCISRY